MKQLISCAFGGFLLGGGLVTIYVNPCVKKLEAKARAPIYPPVAIEIPVQFNGTNIVHFWTNVPIPNTVYIKIIPIK